MGQLDRITQRPDVMGGKACIRGICVTVGMPVEHIGVGQNIDGTLANYPCLERVGTTLTVSRRRERRGQDLNIIVPCSAHLDDDAWRSAWRSHSRCPF